MKSLKDLEAIREQAKQMTGSGEVRQTKSCRDGTCGIAAVRVYDDVLLDELKRNLTEVAVSQTGAVSVFLNKTHRGSEVPISPVILW